MTERRGGGAALVAHSGGPTAVINASLLGLVEETVKRRFFRHLYGARFGLEGILKREFVDLLDLDPARLSRVAQAPSSALGTSRLELGPGGAERLVEAFRTREIRCLFHTGGNGSMGMAAEIAAGARAAGYDLQVIGIPKTIDNDLAETDHTPGYGSAARFFACAAREIGGDNRALPGQVEFVEVLGRHAGWIVASTALARHRPGDAPHLIYLPEQPLPLDRLLADVERVFARLGRCVVAVCEGQLDDRGEAFGADARGGSRGTLAMNLGHRLARLVTERLGIKARAEKPGLLGRVNGPLRSAVDWREARLCGRAAARAAARGISGAMVTLLRQPGPAYHVTTGLAPLERIAGVERCVPPEWLHPEGNDVSPELLEYAAPLVGEIAGYESLE
jgi:ATP-dependent phosphofructokinase / diphosphate-dependent phosphofructokinase